MTKATSKKTTETESAPIPPPPTPPALEREDHLTVQLGLSELQKKELQSVLATKEYEAAQETWSSLLESINKKYGLNPEVDKIDLTSGLIQKG